MKKRNQKGYTIVELVVVIAIIAILAAVLIPTFSSIIKKANTSSDTQLVRNLNTAVASGLSMDGEDKCDTAHQAIEYAKDAGYLVATIVAKSDNKIAWSRDLGSFVLIDVEKGTAIYPTTNGTDELTVTGNEVNYFIISSEMPTEGNALKYSIYAGDGWTAETVDLTAVGFDAGDSTVVKTVNYTNNADGATAKDVVIRTNSFETIVKVNGPSDIVKHYGYAAIVNVEEIKSASYHEFGTVGRLYVQKGHAVVEDESVVVCLMDKDGEGTVATTNIAQTAKVVHDATNETADAEFKAENEQYDSSTQKNAYGVDVNAGTVKDCGAGHHTYGEKIFVDSTYIYEVCACCGYTLISIEDTNGTVVKQTANTIVDGVVTEEKTTPVMTYEYEAILPATIPANTNYTTGDVIIETPVISGQTDEDGNVVTPVSVTCDHNFVYTDHGHDGDEDDHYCFGTCTKCGTTIKRAHDYWYTSGNSGVYEYTGVCSRCECERETKVAQIVGGEKFDTLAEAFNAVHDTVTNANAATKDTYTENSKYEVTIKLLGNENVEIDGNAFTINANEKITLDLNGKQIVGWTEQSERTNLFYINGELIVKDSTDTNNDGTGNGKILTGGTNEWHFDGSNDFSSSYASNLFMVLGTLNIKNGYYESLSTGSAAYVIDSGCKGRVATINIEGGKLKAINTAIRCYQTGDAYILTLNMSAGTIESKTAIQSMCNKNSNESIDNGNRINISNTAFINAAETAYTYYGTGNTFVTITGGKIAGKLEYDGPGEINITGGTFVIGEGPWYVGWEYGEYYSSYGGKTKAEWEAEGYIVTDYPGYSNHEYYKLYSTDTSYSPAYNVEVADGYKIADNGDGTTSVVPE